MELLPKTIDGRLEGVRPRHKSRDSLYKERADIVADMRGINPKLETYKRLAARVAEIDLLIG